MIITKKDEMLYHYIEKNKFATVRQISNMFFKDILYGPTMAKKRLDCLIQHGYIKQSKSTNCSQHIFYVDDKYRKQSKHSIIVMDIYSKFYQLNSLEILDFKKEKEFCNKKVIADAFMTVKYTKSNDTIIQSFLIEVQTSKNDYKNVLNKYTDPNVDLEIRSECDGFAPLLIYVDNVRHNMENITCPYQICQLDENLLDFPLVFDAK